MYVIYIKKKCWKINGNFNQVYQQSEANPVVLNQYNSSVLINSVIVQDVGR